MFAIEVLEGVIKFLLFGLFAFMGLGLLLALVSGGRPAGPRLTDEPRRRDLPPADPDQDGPPPAQGGN